MTVPMLAARKRLARLWFGMGAALLLLVIAASVHRDVDTVKSLWSWFLPAVVPTLSLIIGVVVTEQLGRGIERRETDSFILGLATWLSLGYLALVASSLIFDLIDWLSLESSQLFLAPLQGLVATALSAFFVQKDADTNRNRRASDPPANAAGVATGG